MVADTDRRNRSSGRASRCCTNVLFPDPEAPEITTSRPGSWIQSVFGSLDILNQLADLFEQGLDLNDISADLDVVCLRADRVGFATHFLYYEL